MRADAVALDAMLKRLDLACFRKPRKRDASRVTALVLHGAVKTAGEEKEGERERERDEARDEGEGDLKTRGALKALSHAATIRGLDEHNWGHGLVFCVCTYLHKGSFA